MSNQSDLEDSISDDEFYLAQDEQLNCWQEDVGGETVMVLAQQYQSPYPPLEEAVKAILSSRDPMYEKTTDKAGREVHAVTALSYVAWRMPQFIALYSPKIRHSPYIQLFFDTVKKLDMWLENFKVPGAWSLVEGKKVAERLNDMVDEIRREAATVAFKKSVTRRQENSTKKLQSARQYVVSIFAWRNRLEVIRVDLEYGTDVEEPTLAQARADLAHFMENRRHNRLFDDIGGYIWSLEYGGRGRGYHFHVLFFFDGSKVQKDAYIARKIGEYWVDVVTKGRGAYYNCNGNKKWYQRLNRLGIGRIESDDEQKRHNLDHVVQYLTKKDYCLMPEFDGGRVFGKGKSPRINTSGVGRPRKDRSTAENLHLDQPHLSASTHYTAS